MQRASTDVFFRRTLPKQQNNREEINAELVKDTWHIRKAIAKDIPLQDIPQGAGSGWRYRRPHTLGKSKANAVLQRDEEQELEKKIDTVAPEDRFRTSATVNETTGIGGSICDVAVR
jgi:hypothetical protein